MNRKYKNLLFSTFLFVFGFCYVDLLFFWSTWNEAIPIHSIFILFGNPCHFNTLQFSNRIHVECSRIYYFIRAGDCLWKKMRIQQEL